LQLKVLWLRQRQYEVLDIDVLTYDRSHNFFRRYQLLHLMQEIVDAEPKPLAERTVDYFVDVYLRRFYFTDRHRFHRWIFDDSDSDVDENGNTRLPRHPRTIHRAEVISIFASQAEWILEDQTAKRAPKRLVDLDVWGVFVIRVKRDRKEAARKGIRWGLARGAELELSENDERGRRGSPGMVSRRPKKGKTKASEYFSMSGLVIDVSLGNQNNPLDLCARRLR
jgi:hypothetical protein